jgi:hypothetical protein
VTGVRALVTKLIKWGLKVENVTEKVPKGFDA